jgi:hypothetical protein
MSNKKNIFVIICIALFSVVQVISCTHNPQVPQISFSKDIVPILNTSCVLNSGCHLGGNGVNQNVNLDSADAYHTIIVKELVSTSNPQASLLYSEVRSHEMPPPPAPTLSAVQQMLILYWIQQGALDN